jgi:hypothetical protein
MQICAFSAMATVRVVNRRNHRSNLQRGLPRSSVYIFGNTEIKSRQSCRESAKMETRVTRVCGRWVLQFKTPSMTNPAFWHYHTEQDAMAAEKRLNPPTQRKEAKLIA